MTKLELRAPVVIRERHRDRRSALALAASLLATPILAIVFAATSSFVVFCAMMAALLTAFGLGIHRALMLSAQSRTLTADAEGLCIDGHTTPREQLTEGRIVPLLNGSVSVELRGENTPTLSIHTKSHEVGAQLLSVLGLDAQPKMTTFRGYPSSKVLRTIGVVQAFASLILLFTPSVPWEWRVGPVQLALVAWLVASFAIRRGTLSVGADGLRIDAPGDHRFIPWSEVTDASPRGNGVLLELAGEKRLKLRVNRRLRFDYTDNEADALGLYGRIQVARTQARERQDAREAANRLARNGRSVEAWHDDLRSLGGGFRTAAFDFDDLERVLLDPLAEPSARAGAAVALRRLDARTHTAEGHGPERIRVVAQACAEPRLRVALDRAAQAEDEAALREALAAMDLEGTPRNSSPLADADRRA